MDRRMLGLIAQGVPPREAIAQCQADFGGAFAEQLSQAFAELLQRSVGVAEVRAMPVGGLSLSRRLYLHSVETSAHALAVIKEHAQGVQQARELALRLYDGYAPGDGVVRALEGRARAELPKALRALTSDAATRASLQRVIDIGVAQAQRLKSSALRAAYLEAFDAWKAGDGAKSLQRRLDVAVREKNRFFANRIAQTELARAHQAQRAQEFMADDTIEVVQVMLNPRHLVSDICDLHARADLFGLGPGCYPKDRAPQPTFHPFCFCVLRSRPSLRAADARPRRNGEAAYLRSLPEHQAARVMGSRERLQRVLGGASVDEVINAGVDPLYRLVRLGDGVGHALVRAESAPVNDAYEEAKRAGGKHHGFLRLLPNMGVRQRHRSAQSYQEQIDLHLDKIAIPAKYVPNWDALRESHQASLLRQWRKEVQDHREQIEILKRYEDENP